MLTTAANFVNNIHPYDLLTNLHGLRGGALSLDVDIFRSILLRHLKAILMLKIYIAFIFPYRING